MKKIFILLLLILVTMSRICRAQFPVQDKWYQNPLGFKPLELHTKMGFIIPALVTGTALWLTQKDTSLHQRTRLYSEAGMTFGYKYPYSTILQQTIGMNVQLRKWLSAGAEFSTTLPFDAYNQSIGFSVRPFARLYAVNSAIWKLWFESGGGLIYFTDYFPAPTERDDRQGTRLNGTTKYGIGVSMKLHKHVELMVGVRHLHISNGNTKGEERNPSHDSNGLFAGLTWGFIKP